MRRDLTAAVTLLILSALLAGPLHAQAVEPDRKVVYKTVGKTSLRLHVFTPPDHKTTDRRPAIVFFFGGGWTTGSPTQFYPQCKYLASRGMVAFSAEYRVKKRDGTTPGECVKDGKSAIRWIRRNAAKLGVDPKRIAAGGGSAGGHVAAATGIVSGFEEEGEDASVSCRPDALVLFNPVFDNGPEGYGYDRVKEYWKEISPMHNIGEHAPPTIVFLGTRDSLIPVETARKFEKLMEAKGRRCDLHLFKDQPHGFFNFKNRKCFNETVILTDRFLESLGYLKGKPTLKKTSGTTGK